MLSNIKNLRILLGIAIIAIIALIVTMFFITRESAEEINSELYYSTINKLPSEIKEGFDAEIVSNKYQNGEGVIKFDGVLTKIENNPFESFLTSVTIPDGVVEIGEKAFFRQVYMSHVAIPKSVKKIEDNAFFACKALTHITIPDSVTEIGHGAFLSCEKLYDITLPKGGVIINKKAFSNCDSLKSITIPDGTILIGNPFSSCSSLKEFRGPFSAENGRCLIVDNCLVAFAPDGVKEFIIPDYITSIGDSSFWDAIDLMYITIPNSVTFIGDCAFQGCENIRALTIPDSVETIEDGAFMACKNIRSLTLENGIKTIGANAFWGCENIVSVTIPESVTTIEYPFNNCKRLESVYCKAVTPPAGGLLYFEGTDIEVLYVPNEAVDAYKNARGWQIYADVIVGYDF